MASPAPSSHRHPKKAKAKVKKAVKYRKAVIGGSTAMRTDLVTHFVGGINYYQAKARVPKRVAKSQHELTDAQIDAATARGEERARSEPRALSAEFDRSIRKIVLSFENGAEFKFPPELAQGLEGATDDQLANVRVSGNGFGLHWDSLDADLTVPGVVSGVFGTHRFMAQQAGRSTSPAKAAAARENGAKGGRPRKPANPG